MSAAASYWRNAVRHPEDCGIGNIRRTMDWTEFGEDLKLPIGCLEKGAVPLRISTYVQAAVAGGTPGVTIGTADDPEAFAIADDIAADATGYKTAATGAEIGKALAADTMFYAYISADAEAGKFTVTVEFANRRESIPFREDATDAEDEEEGGGGGEEAPAWVPENAKIHIDFVGGTPQGRAWVDGTGEVAVDTLLGADANTSNGWGDTAYDDANLTANGYEQSESVGTAFIGGARATILAGCTMTCRFKAVAASALPKGCDIYLFDVDGALGVGETSTFDGSGVPGSTSPSSYNSTFTSTLADVLGDYPDDNKIAMTLTSTRLELAANGSSAISETLSADDVGDPYAMICAMIAGLRTAFQSITIYDPLPSTAGLSELSEP